MFWGLIMEPNKRYTQTVEKPFHISQAAMDTSTGDSDICQVMVVVDGKNFLVCTLQKSKTIQAPLDLYFKTGNVVSFLTNGKCNVHLTGYLDPEYDEEASDEEGSEEEEDEAPELVPAKNKRKPEATIESATKKLKTTNSPECLIQTEINRKDANAGPSTTENTEQMTLETDSSYADLQETKKQLKKSLNTTEEESDDEEEEDSSDEEGSDALKRLLAGEVDSDENDDSFRPNSTGADSEEESEEEEAEAEESAVDTSREETPQKLSKNQKRRLKKLQKQQAAGEQPPAPQQNGVDKKKAKKEQPAEQKKGKGAGEEASKAATTPEKREKKQLSGGVHIEDLKVGSGAVAKPGKVVQVYYEGRLKQNNKMFDNCNKGPGFKFRLGSKEVISGWDVGVAGMKVGGKRKILCPPAMAYGSKGSPPVIPPNSALVFEVELKNVK